MKTYYFLFIILIQSNAICFAQDPVTCSTSFLNSDWSSIGPQYDDQFSNLGRVISIWVSPEDPEFILAGTPSSGIWKTIDGGEHWSNLTGFDLAAVGVVSIAVHNNNTTSTTDDIIYGSTWFNGSELNIYSIGLIYSTNGGSTWQYDYSMDSDADLTSNPFIRVGNTGESDITFKPGTYQLLVPNGHNVFLKNVATGDWSIFKNIDDFSTDPDHGICEVDFMPGNSNFIILSPVSGVTNDCKYSDDGGSSWTSLATPSPSIPSGGSLISMRTTTSIPNSTDFYIIYKFVVYVGNDIYGNAIYEAQAFFYKYHILFGTIFHSAHNITGLNYTGNLYESLILNVYGDYPDYAFVGRGQSVFYKALIPSSGDIDFFAASKYFGAYTHADIRAVAYYKNSATSENYIFLAHDGGVSRCDQKELLISGSGDDNDTKWDNINGLGFTITQFNDLSSSELEKNRIFASSADGNSFIYKNGLFTNYPYSADYARASISPVDKTKGITLSNGGFFASSTDTRTVDLDLFSTDVISFPKSAGVDIDEVDENFLNWGFRPLDFNQQGKFWMGTMDIFEYDEVFINSTLFSQRTNNSEFGIDPDVPTKTAITAYARFDDTEEKIITIYYSTKENKSTGDPYKLIAATYNYEDPLAPIPSAIDITPETVIDEIDYPTGENQNNHTGITDVIIDESNPQEVWISFGATRFTYVINLLTENDPNKKGKVYYSPDGGSNWYNRSEGLPNYPVLCLEYWKGSDDIIFAGTDVGVYVWNKDAGTDGEWECFNENMPFGSVSDLEINYCTMNLRAAVYSYGLWETPLPLNAYNSYDNIIVNEDVTWTQSFDTYKSVIVNSGVTLTIENCEIRFPKGSHLIVESGGEVIIDGATLTNKCDFWGGIEVRGNPSAPHPDIEDIYTGIYPVDENDQGVVLIKNGGTIENAEVGITTIGGYFFKGGIIIGQDAVFKNNQTSIIFNGYDYGSADIDDDNISQFYDCDFVVNSDYMQEDFPYHVVMYEVDGVDFLGCRFSDDRSTNPSNSSEGIFSVNATYRVKNVPCPPTGGCPEYLPIESNFTGFFRGIEVANTRYLPRDVEINGVLFETNRRGILLSAVENSLVINNIFEIPDHSTIPGYGLYLEGCKDYQVENNYFTNNGGLGITGSPFRTGIYVMNNSEEHTEIYRNIFEGLEIGIRCQGDNSHLHIKCNDFESIISTYNIYVSSGKLGSQGRCLPEPASWEDRSQAPAGNVFSHDCLNIEADFRVAITTPAIPPFQYRYHTGSTDYRPDLDCYTSSLITLQECSLIGYDQNEYPSCPSRLPEEGGGSSGFMMMSYANETEIGIVEEMAKIDGGSTEELIAEVYNATSESELYDSLKAVGSYLSEEVLTTLVETPYVLNTYLLLDVLNENSPITQDVGNSLEISTYEVPTIIVEELTDTISLDEDGNQISVESPLQLLLDDIDALESVKYSALDEAIKFYLNENKVDSALFAAETNKTNYTSKKKNEIYFTNADYLSAQNSLEFIDVISEEDQDYLSLYSTLIEIYSDDRTIQEIDSVEETEIRNIGGKYTPAGVKALNILKYAYNETHEEIFDEDDEYFYRLSVENQYPTNSKFKLYPNPADEIVYIELLNSDLNSVNLLHVYDLTGKRLQTVELKKDSNVSWINVKDLNPGIYFFEVVSDDNSENGSINSTLKLVIE